MDAFGKGNDEKIKDSCTSYPFKEVIFVFDGMRNHVVEFLWLKVSKAITHSQRTRAILWRTLSRVLPKQDSKSHRTQRLEETIDFYIYIQQSQKAFFRQEIL